MALFIRMILYFVAASISGMAFASFDPDAGTLTVNLDDAGVAVAGVAAYAGTFIWSRKAKSRGGLT